MIPRGLSLDQAPPLSVPLRFFLTAPLFGVAAGLALALGGPATLLSRWSNQALALTHVFVLGVIVMVMLGAMQQMLPVIAGATIPRAMGLSAFVHGAWTLGAPCLAIGLWTGARAWMAAGGILLLAAGLAFVAAAALGLLRSTSRLETVTAMRLALLAFGVTLALGGVLASGRIGLLSFTRSPGLVGIHASAGLVGWVALLIIGVSWQVVPMLQVTPPYPERLRRWLVPLLFALLVARAGLSLGWPGATALADIPLAAGLAAFAVATLLVQSQRKRHVRDASLDLFRAGMAFLLVAVVAGLASAASRVPDERLLLVAALAGIVGFASSVVVAMMLKIVAFLGWFHLQALAGQRIAQGLPPIVVPTMKDLVPDAWSRWQVRVHLGACVLLVAAPLRPPLLQAPAGLALAASFAILLVILVRAALACRAALQPSRPAPSPSP